MIIEWNGKPGSFYAVDVSYTLEEDSWEELIDSVTNEALDDTFEFFWRNAILNQATLSAKKPAISFKVKGFVLALLSRDWRVLGFE